MHFKYFAKKNPCRGKWGYWWSRYENIGQYALSASRKFIQLSLSSSYKTKALYISLLTCSFTMEMPKNPDSLPLELAIDNWGEAIIEFYNKMELPAAQHQELGMPGSFVGGFSGVHLLYDLYPSEAKLVQGMEMELMSIFPRGGGYLVANQSLRNPEFYSRIISPLAKPSPERVLKQLERPFVFPSREKALFPVAIPKGVKLKALTDAVMDYLLKIRSGGISIYEEEIPSFHKLANPAWYKNINSWVRRRYIKS